MCVEVVGTASVGAEQEMPRRRTATRRLTNSIAVDGVRSDEPVSGQGVRGVHEELVLPQGLAVNRVRAKVHIADAKVGRAVATHEATVALIGVSVWRAFGAVVLPTGAGRERKNTISRASGHSPMSLKKSRVKYSGSGAVLQSQVRRLCLLIWKTKVPS